MRRLHLAAALTGTGWHPAAWREPGARAGELLTAGFWADQAREAERGLLEFVTIADCWRSQAPDADGRDDRVDRVRGRLDAILIAARIAPLTEHVGIVPAATTTLTEPFHLSTQIATLDHISHGRAGWLAEVATGADDGGYVGPRLVPPPQARFDEAADHVEVVRRLWDSWEDGAEIRDTATHRFVDREQLHYVDFDGAYFSIRGPSITPRPPQGQPIVATLANTGPQRVFAAAAADVIFITPHDERQLMTDRERLDAALVAAGRDPERSRVFVDVVVFLDDDPGAAAERRARLDSVDGAAYRPDALVFAGRPDELADLLVAWSELGADGFRLRPAAVPHDLRAITRGLVGELQSRGAFRREYECHDLRGLLGLPRPANRYSASVGAP
jgi:alkanesulfonate monooxygenase SsuD/methylene tetrahydromethanopterin reductase-like flavin-dependent oxidoreductase (luciferase family)